MALGIQNSTIEMHSGDSKSFVFTVVDDQAAAVDITNATFRWGLSKLKSESDKPTPRGAALVTKTVGTGIAISNGPQGIVTVTIEPADTATLKGSFYHELEMTLSGNPFTVAFGQIDILLDLLE